MKKRLSLFLSLLMVISIITNMPLSVNAATTPGLVSSDVAYNRIYELYGILGGTFFNTNQKTICGVKSDGHGGEKYTCCRLSRILKESWFTDKFGSLSVSQFPITYYPDGSKHGPDGWSCFAFASFAEWYIYRTASTDKVTTRYVGSFSYDYSTVSSTVQIGDLIRFGNSHSGIAISYDTSGITVLDSNWTGTYNCQVTIHTINYSKFSSFSISRAQNATVKDNSVGTTEKPVNIGDNFFGVILNTAYWKPIHLNTDASVTLETEIGIANQLWYFNRQDDGSYVISSTLNGNALEMRDGNLNSGTQVVCKTYWGGYYQAWWIYKQGNGYVFVSKYYPEYKLALTLSGNNSIDGTPITTETRCNSSGQIWSIYSKSDVQLTTTTLSVSVGDSATDTIFTWDNTYGESAYYLKIWKNEIGQGDANYIVCSSKSGYKTQLPAGTYQAYVDTFNHYQCLRSNVITFTVPKKTYDIIYNANGGSGAPGNQTKYYNTTLVLSSTKPTRPGYNFLGWSTSSTATSASYYPGGKYTSNSGKTLYAVWEKKTISTAERKSLNTIYSGNLSGSSDINWYKFELPANGVVHFNFSHEYVNTSKECWRVFLYDANDNCYQISNYVGNYTKNTREAAIGLPKGTYYIKIVSANKYSSAKYSFKFEFAKDNYWETELNDTSAYADTRSTGKTYYGSLHYVTDVDWYKFTLSKDSKISLNFTHDYANKSDFCWTATLYNSNKQAIRSWSFKGKDTRTIKSGDIGVSAGTYYLKITSPEANSTAPELEKPISQYKYSSANYYFKLNCSTPGVWESESNNATNTADSLTLNKFKYGSLHAENDIDYLKINISKSGKYVLNVAHDYVDSTNSYWIVALLDNNHKQIDYMALKGTKTDVVKSKVAYLNKGTYYLMVKKGKSFTSMANYRVMLSEHLAEPALEKVYNGPNGIEFSWKPISNAEGYIVCRKEGNGGWKRLATLSGTSKSSYVDKALKAGVKYTYTVKAYKGDAYSYYSEAGLPVVRLSKAGITGLYSVSNGVRITWHKTTGAAGYMIYRSTGNGVFTKIATIKGYNSVSYIDKTAKKGVKYIYRTKAYNGASVSATSDPKSIIR